ATTVTSGPTSSRMRSYRSWISAGDVGDHPLASGPSGVPAVREERFGLASGAAVEAVDALDSGGAECALGAGPEVGAAFRRDIVTEALAEGRRDLLPHLVATGSDSRSDCGRQGSAPERLGACGDDSGEQPSPAGVEDGERGLVRVCPRDGDRQAVGGH